MNLHEVHRYLTIEDAVFPRQKSSVVLRNMEIGLTSVTHIAYTVQLFSYGISLVSVALFSLLKTQIVFLCRGYRSGGYLLYYQFCVT